MRYGFWKEGERQVILRLKKKNKVIKEMKRGKDRKKGIEIREKIDKKKPDYEAKRDRMLSKDKEGPRMTKIDQ